MAAPLHGKEQDPPKIRQTKQRARRPAARTEGVAPRKRYRFLEDSVIADLTKLLEAEVKTLRNLRPGQSKAFLNQEIDLCEMTLKAMRQPFTEFDFKEFSTRRDAAIKEAKVLALSIGLSRAVTHLERLARGGQPAAIKLLANLSLGLSKQLSELRAKSANHLKSVARETLFWPILKSNCLHFDDTKKPLDRAHAKILDDLEVGKNHPIKGRRWNPKDGLGELVTDLFDQVYRFKIGGWIFQAGLRRGWRTEALKLPKFEDDEKVVKQWGQVMLLVLKERFPCAQHLVKAHGALVTEPSKRKGVGTITSELRANIVKRLKSMAGLRKSK